MLVSEEMNRIHNSSNPYQGKFKRVLCVCSAGLLRSPTAALVLSQEPFGFNTRSAGIEDDFALIPVDRVLVEWADQIVCMTIHHREELRERYPEADAKIVVLDIDDNYEYCDPELMKQIAEKYRALEDKV